MKKKIFVLLFLLFVCMPLFSEDDGVYIFCSVDKKKLTIGDKIVLSVVLEYPAGLKYEFNPEENLKSFEIKDFNVKEKKKYFLFGPKIKSYRYVLSTFITGIYEIKPFTVSFTAAGEPVLSQSNPIKIEVTSLLDKESAVDIRDIKPPVNLRRGIIFYALVFGSPILFLAGYFVHRNYFKKKDFLRVMEKIVDPYQYAMDKLSKLENMELIKKRLVKEFYVQLSQTIRIYLSKIFSVNILDMTTTESVRALREKNADKKFLIELRGFFENADLVKFAKYIPEEKEIISDFETAKNIVEAVKPQQLSL